MDTKPLIFISHSNADAKTAEALIHLVRDSLNLKPHNIRCTSVDGYRLPAGAKTSDQLREELLLAPILIGIISPQSLSSAYVLFELGARWGASKPLIPLLAPGVRAEILAGPLLELNALSCDSEEQLHQLVSEVASLLSITVNPPNTFLTSLKKVKHSTTSPKKAPTDNYALSKPSPIRLGEEHRAVLRVFRETGEQFVDKGYVARELGWKEVRIDHFIEELSSAGMLDKLQGKQSLIYRLSKIGREVILEEGI